MDASYEVRRATSEDEPSWVNLYADIANEGDWIGGQPPFEPGRLQRSFHHRMQSRPGGMWVVIFEGGVVGWIDLRLDDEGWMYVGMGVATVHRGQGLGQHLLTVAERECQLARGMKLDVFDHNARAIHLYEKFGFVRIGPPVPVPRKDGRVFESQEMRKVTNHGA